MTDTKFTLSATAAATAAATTSSSSSSSSAAAAAATAAAFATKFKTTKTTITTTTATKSDTNIYANEHSTTAERTASDSEPITSTKSADATATEEVTLESLEIQYVKAMFCYKRLDYEKCIEICNLMLQSGQEDNVQIFTKPPDETEFQYQQQHQTHKPYGSSQSNINSSKFQRFNVTADRQQQQQQQQTQQQQQSQQQQQQNTNSSNKKKCIMPTWLMEVVWQLKMRASTKRVYIDDLETQDFICDEVTEEIECERLATAARPGTSINTAFMPRPSTSQFRASTSFGNRTETQTSAGRNLSSGPSTRPKSGFIRPGTSVNRPGTTLGARPATRCATASRIRSTSAAAFTIDDETSKLYQASRLNPTIYAEREGLVKTLFEFLYYHESDVQKAYSLCEAVMDVQKQKNKLAKPGVTNPPIIDWWWNQQIGRCLILLRYPRKAEEHLKQSLSTFAHPDTFLLLSRLYQRIKEPERALELITSAISEQPYNVALRVEQGRIYDAMARTGEAIQIYRLVTRLNPINIEALSCIALHYFYDNNPELALMYYRRILALGIHTPELYCNTALCCLYGGQIDLVLPCFQRAMLKATTPEQKADIWYNQSFVGLSVGDYQLARRCLQLCLVFDANNVAAMNNLAVLAANNNDLQRAKSYLTAAIEIAPDYMEVQQNIKFMNDHYKL